MDKSDKSLKKNAGSLGTSISGLSEISDHEDDFLNISKKLQEKDEELENLRKDMRNLEHTSKKAQIELENELNYWKMKTDNIQQDISNKPIMKLANDLQKKLSDKEYEILALKDSELSLKRELFQLKENNLHLKNSNTLLNHRSNRPKSVSIEFNEKRSLKLIDRPAISGISTNKISVLNQIDEKAEFVKTSHNPTHEVLFNCIQSLKGEKQALVEDLNKIKEIAIESVVEKEKELIELKNKFEENEINYKNQLEIANDELEVLRMKMKFFEGDSESSSPKHAASLAQFRSLENELEGVKKLYREEKITFLNEREMLEQRIKELIMTNDIQESDFKRKLEKMNKEMDDQIYAKVREDTQNSKEVQQEILKELQSTEEKYRDIQKKYVNAQQELRSIQNNHEKENAENNNKIKDLMNKLKKYENSEQAKLDLEKKTEGNAKKLFSELELKQEKIQSLEAAKLEISKKLTFMDGELNQYKMKNVLLKENCDNLKMENEELKSKSNEDFNNFQSSIAELDLKYSQEKDNLEHEIKRLKEMYEPEAGRGTLYGTLRNDLNTEEPIITIKKSIENRGSLSPSPQMRVSILEAYDKEDQTKDEFEKVVADSDVYLDLKSQIEEKDEKIEELTEKNKELNDQINRLIESYTKEINDLKDNQKTNLNDFQNMRRTFIQKTDESAKEIESNKEINRLKVENFKLQTSLNENKQIFENEVNFLKEENIRLENKMKNYKENYGKIVSERDLYIQRYAQIVSHIKKKKQAMQNSESTGSLFGIRLSLFRR